MSNKAFGAFIIVSALLAPAAAMAASIAVATTNVNLRTGPSTQYPVVNVVGSGDDVRVYGCLSNRSWCDVGYAGQRGWMSSNYLAYAPGTAAGAPDRRRRTWCPSGIAA